METNTPTPEAPVIVVGAGLAGLCCARELHAAGLPVLVLEAEDRVGGRVTSDDVDGFVIDRGFQALLTSYPEAQRSLDLGALDLGRFEAGALVRTGGRFRRVLDPWRRPLRGLSALAAPIFTPMDALRIARLRRSARGWAASQRRGTTMERLRGAGLSERAIDRFFRPLFGGAFLDRDLETPAWMFDFTLDMLARGSAALPAGGMRRIGEQLASSLPRGTVRLAARVAEARVDGVTTDAGERIAARAVVIATDPTAARALGRSPGSDRWRGCTTLSYATDRAPLDEPILALNAEGGGPVNHVCVPSAVSPSYAPAGGALVSLSVLGVPDLRDDELDRACRAQMRGWFGAGVSAWRLLRVDRIARALPRAFARGGGVVASEQMAGGAWACGDAYESPSIHGAMLSGRRTGKAMAAVLPRARPGA